MQARQEVGDDHRSPRYRLQQGPRIRPRFLPRRSQILFCRCWTGLADLRLAASGGGFPSWAERSARDVFHVRRPESNDGVTGREENPMWCGEGRTLGKSDYDRASWRRKGWVVRAEASDGDWAVIFGAVPDLPLRALHWQFESATTQTD